MLTQSIFLDKLLYNDSFYTMLNGIHRSELENMAEEGPPITPPRLRTNWELRYVSEFAARTYPDEQVFTYVRLGKDPAIGREEELSEEELRMLRVGMRWADCVVIRAREILIIEGKLKPGMYPEGIAKLEIYTRIARKTPDLAQYLPRKIVGAMLVPTDDPITAMIAREKGFRWIVWKPDWFQEFQASLTPRAKRPARME
jgi:hypothetical protein